MILNNHKNRFFSLENIVGMSVTEGMDTAFGSRTRKGMFRTVSQLYKVSVFHSPKMCLILTHFGSVLYSK